MTSVILGINAFHPDSAACVLIDGELKAAIAEERLGKRQRHCSDFPANAIRRVLEIANLELKDLTHVAVSRNPQRNMLAKARYVMGNPVRSMAAVWEHLDQRRRTASTVSNLADVCGKPQAHAKYKVVAVEHHLAHLASAYYASPFESLTAGFSYDASGDFISAMAARCEGSRIEVLDRVALPHSLGFFYTALCQFIGFDEFGEEYKVMGLAPYGKDRYAGLMEKLVRLNGTGWFKLANRYFGMHDGGRSGVVDDNGKIVIRRLYSDRLVHELGTPRNRREPITQREKDLARSCQERFEAAALHCLRKLHKLVPSDRLVMAGGCALNGVGNARILRESSFKSAYLQAAASDDGTCLGAAFWCYHNVVKGKNRFHMRHAFWGPEYSDSHMRQAAETTPFAPQRFQQDQLPETVASLLTKGKVVGWFQGRSEWGPRALGNRSILADPTQPGMKGIINAKIKRRESFRPFAPSVLKENVNEYFEQSLPSPFMMHVVKFQPHWREKLPAVAHVDGTGRLQSVGRDENSLYYDLINKFREKSGVAMVLNTSFNENEPIVDTPQQAVDCFMRTDLDALCLGNYLLVKPASAPAGFSVKSQC